MEYPAKQSLFLRSQVRASSQTKGLARFARVRLLGQALPISLLILRKKRTVLQSSSQELGFVLKSEQREALELLLKGKDVFCVLPTGFDKSLIYRMFVHAKSSSSFVQRPTVIVILCYLAWLKKWDR